MYVQKSILVFSNGEKIGDGIIKLSLLNEIKRRLPDFKLVWIANGTTVYNNHLKNIASQFIDQIFDQAYLNPFFWQKISNKYNFENLKFEYILDTQKTVFRTIALKRINCSFFISNAASGFFLSKNNKKKIQNRFTKYYLEDLFDLLNLIKEDKVDKNFKFPIPKELFTELNNFFDHKNKYIGIAPGAGEKNKIWPLENFIKIGKNFEKEKFKIVFFLGPEENFIKEKIKKEFPNSLFPEENIQNFSGFEVVMASTKFLSCALTNDSGVAHMLSTNYCPLVKLFGHKDPAKFTPINKNISTISSDEFGSKKISDIPPDFVQKKLELKIISNNNV